MGISYVRSLVHACAAAFLFLSRLPVIGIRPDFTGETNRRSLMFYPFVGFVIGSIVALFAYGLSFILPMSVVAVITLVIWIGLSGALHLDGLLDTADGMLSHRSRERMLEIMKDSRVGAMGIIVCICYVLLKVVLIVSLLEDPAVALIMLVLAPIWSRWFMSAAIVWWPYVRGESGMGSMFREAGHRHIWIGALIALTSSTIGCMFISWLPGIDGANLVELVVLLGAIFLLTVMVGTWIATVIARKLGGLTGDTYGALNELLELIILLAMVIFIHSNS